jgi:hypothetical protein
MTDTKSPTLDPEAIAEDYDGETEYDDPADEED